MMSGSPDITGDQLLVPLAQAARMLGVCGKTLAVYADRGEIPEVRIGTRRLYSPASLRRWIAEREGAATTA